MTRLYPLLVVLLAVFAVAPLEYPGTFQSHTGLLAYYNLIQLDQNPSQLLAWVPAIGKAPDLLRSDGLLPYIAAEILHWIGFNYLDSIKLIYAIAWVASGLAMYALARRYLSQPASLLASVVYVYLPFHVASVYVRGALGEASSWAVFPVALLAVLSIGTTARRSWRGVLAFLLLYLGQPGMAILFGLFTLGLAAVQNRHALSQLAWAILSVAGGLVLGLVLSAPAILSGTGAVTAAGFSPHFVLPFQLFSSSWGAGVSQEFYTPPVVSSQTPPAQTFPFQLGVVPIALAILAVALASKYKGAGLVVSPAKQIAYTYSISAALLILFVLDISAPAWRILGFLATFPWQLLAFVGFSLALVAGSVLDLDARFKQPAIVAFFVALPVLASYPYLSPRYLDFSPSRPMIATFENNEVALLDYRIVGPLRHGATLRLEFQWQALREVNHDYTVFVHAVNEDGETYGSEDAKPGDGSMPTIKWTPGQVISDTHTIQISVDGPRDGYHLEVGLYNAATGRRAAMDSGAEVLILPRPGDPEPVISDQIPLTSAQ